LKGGGTYWQDKITDLTELRPWEQKIKDDFAQRRKLKGLTPTCYTRFKGTEREEYFCDKHLQAQKDEDRDLFVNAPVFSEAEKQALAAAPEYDREIVLARIKWDREKYLAKLDDTINSTHIPLVQGYPPRFTDPHVDLVGGAYFEKQEKRYCTIHSLNNVLGYRAATVKSMNSVAREMAREIAEKGAHGKKNRTYEEIYDEYLPTLMSEDGNYSVNVAMRWMKNNGISNSLVSLRNVDFSEGSYIVSTFKNGVPHSVAVKDGLLLDSLEDDPVLIEDKLPSEYIANAAVEVGKSPTKGESFINLISKSKSV
jgi:hypothetical protein